MFGSFREGFYWAARLGPLGGRQPVLQCTICPPRHWLKFGDKFHTSELRTLLNPSIWYCWDGPSNFSLALNLSPMMPRDYSLSDSYTSNRCPFSSLATILSVIHWENYISIFFHIEWDMIVVTVFLWILNQMEIHLVQNRRENCDHDHIPFNVK